MALAFVYRKIRINDSWKEYRGITRSHPVWFVCCRGWVLSYVTGVAILLYAKGWSPDRPSWPSGLSRGRLGIVYCVCTIKKTANFASPQENKPFSCEQCAKSSMLKILRTYAVLILAIYPRLGDLYMYFDVYVGVALESFRYCTTPSDWNLYSGSDVDECSIMSGIFCEYFSLNWNFNMILFCANKATRSECFPTSTNFFHGNFALLTHFGCKFIFRFVSCAVFVLSHVKFLWVWSVPFPSNFRVYH